MTRPDRHRCEEARRRGSEHGGYQPPAAAPDVGLDKEARNLLRMTPEDYQFPVPTRVTDITGHRLPARGAAQPIGGDREAASLEASRALERRLERMTEQPGMASPVPSEHTTSRLWDAWDMNTRAKLPPPRNEEAAGYPTVREAPVTLPIGERPADLRADPFLTCRAEAALSRGAATNEPNSGISLG